MAFNFCASPGMTTLDQVGFPSQSGITMCSKRWKHRWAPDADLSLIHICRIFEELRPSSVVHCAAATDVDWCEEQPDEAYRINAIMPATLAAISSRSDVRLLYISTDSVFDGARGDYAETDEPEPVNVYARSKLHGERAVLRENPVASIARVNLLSLIHIYLRR